MPRTSGDPCVAATRLAVDSEPGVSSSRLDCRCPNWWCSDEERDLNPPYEQVLVESRGQWRRWLAEHHARSHGIWLVTWKKGSGGPVVPAADISEEALCFGWVDSRPSSLDAERSMLLLTPRRPRSSWSRVNKERVERLMAAGLMEPAGLAAVAVAKANGSWSALDAVEDLVEPDDLRRALDAEPVARRHWDAFPRSTRRAILEWIGTARTEATREARVRRTVSDAAVNIRANQWRQPRAPDPRRRVDLDGRPP